MGLRRGTPGRRKAELSGGGAHKLRMGTLWDDPWELSENHRAMCHLSPRKPRGDFRLSRDSGCKEMMEEMADR